MLSLYIVSRMILDFPQFKWAEAFLKGVYLDLNNRVFLSAEQENRSTPVTVDSLENNLREFRGKDYLYILS